MAKHKPRSSISHSRRQFDRRWWSRENGSKRCTNFCDSTEQRHTFRPSSVHTDYCSAENLAPNYHVSQQKTVHAAARENDKQAKQCQKTYADKRNKAEHNNLHGLTSCPVHSFTNQCSSLTYVVPPSQQLTTITRSGKILLVSRRYSIHCRALKKWVVEKSMSLLGQSCRQHRLQSSILRIRVSAMLRAMQSSRRLSSLQPLARFPCNNDHNEAGVFPAVWMTTRSTRTMQNVTVTELYIADSLTLYLIAFNAFSNS